MFHSITSQNVVCYQSIPKGIRPVVFTSDVNRWQRSHEAALNPAARPLWLHLESKIRTNIWIKKSP